MYKTHSRGEPRWKICHTSTTFYADKNWYGASWNFSNMFAIFKRFAIPTRNWLQYIYTFSIWTGNKWICACTTKPVLSFCSSACMLSSWWHTSFISRHVFESDCITLVIWLIRSTGKKIVHVEITGIDLICLEMKNLISGAGFLLLIVLCNCDCVLHCCLFVIHVCDKSINAILLLIIVIILLSRV